MAQVPKDLKPAPEWYKSRTFWTFVVGELAVTQVAWEAVSRAHAPADTAMFGWLTATALLLQNVFIRQQTVTTGSRTATDVKGHVQGEVKELEQEVKEAVREEGKE